MRRSPAALLTLLTISMLGGLVGACVLWLQSQQRQYTLNRKLIAALVQDDDRQALALVNEGADPNTRYDPPPAVASLFEQLEQLFHPLPPLTNDSPTAFSIACGADWSDGKGPERPPTPDNPQLVQAMLQHGANVNAQDETGWTPLWQAFEGKRRNTINVLLNHKADVNAKEAKFGRTLLMWAAEGRDPSTVLLLLDHGADINAQDKQGQTPLCCAVEVGADRVVQQLLARGANPNIPTNGSPTPLRLAQIDKRTDIIVLLKHAGVRK